MISKTLVAADGDFLHIPPDKWRIWEVDYPGVDLNVELKKANKWLERNPGRRWKTVKGFQSWLDRAYERVEQKDQITTVPANESKHPALYKDENEIGELAYNYASEEAVQDVLRAVKSLLVAEGIPEPEKPVEACTHAWSLTHFGRHIWCEQCGLYQDQLVDDFEYLTAIARGL